MKIYFATCLLSLNFLSVQAQNALDFDGLDDRVDCGNSTSMQLSGSNLTLEAWIFPRAWRSQVWEGNIINKETNAPDYGYMLRCGDNGRLNMNLGDGSWHELTTAANTLSLNVWQHVAGTYDGSKIRLYLNGTLIDSISLNVSFSSAQQNLNIGNWSNPGTDRTFFGAIDEARVWNVARTRAEINAGMNGELCSPANGLVACYRFNEGTAGVANSGVNIASDFSNNANNGTLLNFGLNGSTSNWVNGAGITPGSSFRQVNANGCNEYLGPGGKIYDSSGVYLDTLQSIYGCDSVIETNLNMKYADVGVTATGTSLMANQDLASYRWLDCNDGFKLVSGGTKRTFIPPDPSGSYAVRVDFGGCIDTSACYRLSSVGIQEDLVEYESVYPNPARSFVIVEHNNIDVSGISLFDLSGALVKRVRPSRSETKIILKDLSAGVYVIVIKHYKYVKRFRLIIS